MFDEPLLYDQFDRPITGNNNGLPPDTPMLLAIRGIDEAMTLSKLKDRNKGWFQAGGTGSDLAFDLMYSWEYLKKQYVFKGPVRNIVRNLSMLTGSPEFTFEKDRDASEWKEKGEANRFPNRWTSIIRHTYLWNDYLTVLFRGGPSDIAIRNLEPYRISEVEHEGGDVEDIVQYKRAGGGDALDAKDVIHHVLERVGNEKRGIPLLSCILQELHYYYQVMKDLYYVSHIRARLPAVRTVRGGAAAVNAEVQRLEFLPGPGRVAVENEGGDWKFPPAYANLKDADVILNVFLKGMALGLNLPAFLVSSDYTNNSLASTLSADSPTSRMIKANRAEFSPQFREVISKALERPVEVGVTWPAVVERDKKADAEAYEIGIDKGALSARDMAEDVFGKGWKETDKRIGVEAAGAVARYKNMKTPLPGEDD